MVLSFIQVASRWCRRKQKDDPLMDALTKHTICSLPFCDRPHVAKGLCFAHYAEQRKGNELKPLRSPKRARLKPDKGCSFPGCDKAHKAKGLCASHYHQQKRGEEVRPLRRRATGAYGPQTGHLPVTQRLQVCSIRSDKLGCLIWSRGVNQHEYGVISLAGKAILAHRLSYETFVGPIPKGKIIDHICGTRSCIEPSHLRVVTRGQNSQYRPGMAMNPRALSGILGVHYNEPTSSWQAKFMLDGEWHFVGSFDTVEEAALAVRERRAEVNGMGDPESNREMLRQLWLDRKNDPSLLSPTI